jgi:hypothetical protein
MTVLYYQSARGVYHDIKHSHFICEVDDFLFYFTSEYNMNRFKDRYQDEVKEFNKKIERVYKNNHHLIFNELALIRLYQKIEKRGFYLFYKGELFTCPENIVFRTELTKN